MIHYLRAEAQSAYRILVLALAMVACGSALGQPQGPGGSVEIQPGLLLDTIKDRAFLMTPHGSIEAVDVVTGNSLWVSDSAEKPLAVSPGRLIAQSTSRSAGILPLTIIDPDDGRVILQREARLPDPVQVSVDEKLSSRFQLESSDQQSGGRLAWRYHQGRARGMPTENPDSGISLSGEFRIDPQSGAIDVLANRAPARVPVDLELPSADRSQARRFRSSDDAFVLVSEALEPSGPSLRYRWQIQDSSGAVLGQTETSTSYSPFAVSGNMLLFTTPPQNTFLNGQETIQGLTLRGIDLSTGTERWSREIRDTRYTGPFPY